MSEGKGRRCFVQVETMAYRADISRANRRAPNIYYNDRRPTSWLKFALLLSRCLSQGNSN